MDELSILEITVFIAVVIAALLVDLKLHRDDRPVPLRDAALWSVLWVALSLGFAVFVAMRHGTEDASLFLAGYMLEKSLSVDNLFVFMAIFSSFRIADGMQHRVLYYGILGALILRMIFVAAGSSVLLLFGKWAMIGFGLFVLWSAWKMFSGMGADEDGDGETDYTNHWSVKMTRKLFPVHHKLEGHKFFFRPVPGAVIHCTPLFLCLVALEIADVMFAFDSVPAVIAITQKPFLVYTSNIFAILGLRSMYFLLAAAKRYLVHLEKAVILILAFIGGKMLLDVAGVLHISPMQSLAIVGTCLMGGVVASLLWPDGEPETATEKE